MQYSYDFVIIGAGISGLYISYKLITDNPQLRILLVDGSNSSRFGRVRTFDNYDFQTCLDNFKPESHPQLWKLTKDLNIPTTKHYESTKIYKRNKTKLSFEILELINEFNRQKCKYGSRLDISQKLSKWLSDNFPDISQEDISTFVGSEIYKRKDIQLKELEALPIIGKFRRIKGGSKVIQKRLLNRIDNRVKFVYGIVSNISKYRDYFQVSISKINNLSNTSVNEKFFSHNILLCTDINGINLIKDLLSSEVSKRFNSVLTPNKDSNFLKPNSKKIRTHISIPYFKLFIKLQKGFNCYDSKMIGKILSGAQELYKDFISIGGHCRRSKLSHINKIPKNFFYHVSDFQNNSNKVLNTNSDTIFNRIWIWDRSTIIIYCRFQNAKIFSRIFSDELNQWIYKDLRHKKTKYRPITPNNNILEKINKVCGFRIPKIDSYYPWYTDHGCTITKLLTSDTNYEQQLIFNPVSGIYCCGSDFNVLSSYWSNSSLELCDKVLEKVKNESN